MRYVYKITNNVNNWVYVGITTREPKKRWAEHLRGAKSKKRRLYNGMRKHGVENFNMEVIAILKDLKSLNPLYELEKNYIKSFNSYWFGYNDTIGGRGIVRPKRGRKRKR